MNSELLRGNLELMVLSILRDGPAHGYAVIKELRTRSAGSFKLPEGTVYPALYRLERAGLVVGRDDEDGQRKRRVYRISRRGLGALSDKREQWEAFAHSVRLVLGEA